MAGGTGWDMRDVKYETWNMHGVHDAWINMEHNELLLHVINVIFVT